MTCRRPLPLLCAAAFALLVTVSPPAGAADGHWTTQAQAVAKAIDASEASFAKGDVDGAKRVLTDAYFHHFEDTKLEAAIRRFVGAKRAAEIEKSFATLRKAMNAGDGAQVKAVAQSIRDAVATEGKALDAAKVAPGVFEVNQ